MAYETLAERNVSEGFQTLFVYVNDVTGGVFTNTLLFSLFVVTFLGSYFAQKRLSTDPNLAMSFAVSGYFVTGLALILSLIPGMVNILSVIICIAVSILGTLWLYLSKSAD